MSMIAANSTEVGYPCGSKEAMGFCSQDVDERVAAEALNVRCIYLLEYSDGQRIALSDT